MLYGGATLQPARNLRRLGAAMMAGLFAILLVAFLFNLVGLRGLAVTCLVVSLGLCLGIFLWEIYSPETGFRMPWIEV